MSKENMSFEEVLEFIEDLPYSKFRKLVNHYASRNSKAFEQELNNRVILDLQSRLEKLNIHKHCPHCQSSKVVKNGKRANEIQEYKCKVCSTKYTLFTGTLLEKTRYDWDSWVKMLEMTLNNYSLHKMIHILEEEYGYIGINYKTIWHWRMKLIHALAMIPMPVLTGIIQIGEIRIKDSNKGNRRIIIEEESKEKGDIKQDVILIISAIDNRGYCVSKVMSNEEFTTKRFKAEYKRHISAPAYICSYPIQVYEAYSKEYNIPHFIKPFQYINDRQTQTLIKVSHEICKEETIKNKGNITYEEIKRLKEIYHLGLEEIEEINLQLQVFINQKMTNVNTRYLQDYLGLYVFKKNWQVTYGYLPISKEDAEKIFIELLQCKKQVL